MNQQEYFRGGYGGGNIHISSGPSRQQFNNVPGTHGNMRVRPGHLDGSQPQVTVQYPEERFNTYTDLRHARIHSPQGYADTLHAGNFVTSNTQAWAHNSGANTVNGVMTDGGRSRSSGRPALPTEWYPAGDSNQVNQTSFVPIPYALPNTFIPQMAMNGSATLKMNERQSFLPNLDRLSTPKSLPSDLIPTAIVIKNIPFNVRKEQLAMLMQELNLPTPYAFNYHFDQGIFRGLAFANFQNSEDTWQVIESLNGYEVSGRKLRVEYKKMLPEAERERIEREKREKRGQLEEQHQPLKISTQDLTQTFGHANGPPSAPMGSRADAIRDLDMNDQETLRYFTELMLFRNDPAREIIVFPQSMTASQRRIVHTLAHHMGLAHQSAGEGGQRQLNVRKPGTAISPGTGASVHVPSVHQNRGLNRAATIDFAETRDGGIRQYTSSDTLARAARPHLALPESPDVNLRGVKSFADLREPRSTPSPAPSIGQYGLNGHGSNVAIFGDYAGAAPFHGSSLTTPTTPGGNDTMHLPNLSNLSLADNFFATQTRSQQNPGAIGSQRPGLSGSSRAQPDRQPMGPAAGERGELGGWRRPNGHKQRDSDSSADGGPRGASASGASRFQ